MMKTSLIVMMVSSGLVAGAIGQDTGAKVDGAAAVGIDEAMPKDVTKLLDEQLIVADGEKVKATKLEKGMEYYLVYHSASW
ncbi:MAG: hypothetical protein ACR2RV_12440 [Verrucomicrobiales bacterium]